MPDHPPDHHMSIEELNALQTLAVFLRAASPEEMLILRRLVQLLELRRHHHTYYSPAFLLSVLDALYRNSLSTPPRPVVDETESSGSSTPPPTASEPSPPHFDPTVFSVETPEADLI